MTFAVAAFALCASVTRCVAQEPSPVIYLSTAEAAKAKQAAQDLKNAQDRDSRALAIPAGLPALRRTHHSSRPKYFSLLSLSLLLLDRIFIA